MLFWIKGHKTGCWCCITIKQTQLTMTRKTTVLMNLALTVDLVACFHQQYLQQTDPDANPSRSIAHIIFLHNTHQTTPQSSFPGLTGLNSVNWKPQVDCSTTLFYQPKCPYSTSHLISIEIWPSAGIPSWYATSHSDQLSFLSSYPQQDGKWVSTKDSPPRSAWHHTGCMSQTL